MPHELDLAEGTAADQLDDVKVIRFHTKIDDLLGKFGVWKLDKFDESEGFVWNCTNSHRLLYASMFFNDFTGSRLQSAMRAVTVSRRLSTHAMLPGSRIRCSSSSNLQMFERLIKV